MTSPLERKLIADIKSNIEENVQAEVNINVLPDGALDVTSTEVDIDTLEFGGPGNPPTRPIAKGVDRTIATLDIRRKDIDPRGILF